MSLFSAAIDAIFNDPNMAADAVFTPAATGTPVDVRVIFAGADERESFGAATLHISGVTLDLRASDVADPRPGDAIVITNPPSDPETPMSLLVQGEPEKRDPRRLVWTINTRPAE